MKEAQDRRVERKVEETKAVEQGISTHSKLSYQHLDKVVGSTKVGTCRAFALYYLSI